jgi:hypothetical protein
VTLDQRHVRRSGDLERLPRRADGGPEVGDEHAGARQTGEQVRAATRIAIVTASLDQL